MSEPADLSVPEHLGGELLLNDHRVASWSAHRRPGPPVRRVPEPLLDETATRFYATRVMGNDVYEWDWLVKHNGRTVSNLPETPLEHRVSDGPVTLLAKILAAYEQLPLTTRLDQADQAHQPA